MAVVTDIKEQRGRIIIDVDGRRLCSVKPAFYRKLPVQVDDVIDEDAYLDKLALLQMDPCYEDALTMLDFSMRATGEMRTKLGRKGYLSPAIDSAIDRLLASGLLNDAAYAERMVQQATGKPVGLYSLKRKLRAKGVDDSAAEAALGEIQPEDQQSAARALAEKSLHKYEGMPRREARAKLSQLLARRGFSWDAISGALEGLMEDEYD